LFNTENGIDDQELVNVMQSFRQVENEELENEGKSSLANSSMEAVCRSFFWELFRTGVSSVDTTQLNVHTDQLLFSHKVFEAYSKHLPSIEVLLVDVCYHGNRFCAWVQLLCELVDLYYSIQDCIAENVLLSSIPPECHEFDENVSMRYSLSAISIPKSSDDFVVELLSRKRLLFRLVLRVFCCLKNAFLFSDSADDQGDTLTFARCIETMGIFSYQTALQFPKGSELRRKYTKDAFDYFSSGEIM
jgi:hypothetical protein